MMNEVDLPSS